MDHIIAVDGMNNTGKSTAIARVKKRFGAQVLCISSSDTYLTIEPLIEKLFPSFTKEYKWSCVHALIYHICSKTEHKVIILDRCVLSLLVYNKISHVEIFKKEIAFSSVILSLGKFAEKDPFFERWKVLENLFDDCGDIKFTCKSIQEATIEDHVDALEQQLTEFVLERIGKND